VEADRAVRSAPVGDVAPSPMPSPIFEVWPGQPLPRHRRRSWWAAYSPTALCVYLLGDSQTGRMYHQLRPELISLFGEPEVVRFSPTHCNRADFFGLQRVAPLLPDPDGGQPHQVGRWFAVVACWVSAIAAYLSLSLSLSRPQHRPSLLNYPSSLNFLFGCSFQSFSSVPLSCFLLLCSSFLVVQSLYLFALCMYCSRSLALTHVLLSFLCCLSYGVKHPGW
jgi:hypothetical protein